MMGKTMDAELKTWVDLAVAGGVKESDVIRVIDAHAYLKNVSFWESNAGGKTSFKAAELVNRRLQKMAPVKSYSDDELIAVAKDMKAGKVVTDESAIQEAVRRGILSMGNAMNRDW
jgi:hypothetical protein